MIGQLKVGLHSLGFVAKTKDEAVEKYYPGYKKWFDEKDKKVCCKKIISIYI